MPGRRRASGPPLYLRRLDFFAAWYLLHVIHGRAFGAHHVLQRRVGHVHLLLVRARQESQPSLLIARIDRRGLVLAGLLGDTPGADPCLKFLPVLRCDRSAFGCQALDVLMRAETLLPVVTRERAALLQVLGLRRRTGSV